jgi:alginate O-acetyltransferase complex protein AlgI
MLFNSIPFLCFFFPITYFGFFAVSKKAGGDWGAFWLAISSLIFYGWADWTLVPLLVGSICMNYLVGLEIGRQKRRGTQKTMLLFGIAVNLSLLAYFKYSNFFLNSLFHLFSRSVPDLQIVLPIGISFFTFTQIAFLVDTYRLKAHEYRPVHYVLFVSYFPHLIAGPILHHSEMMPQFARSATYRFHVAYFVDGLSTFLVGLAKKIVIADSLATYVSPVFAAADSGIPCTFFECWAGALCFTFQLYFDFSGYSDMAIGLSRMFGVELPLNFNSPYKATSIIVFWRRWHMTLSRFLRDYLYFPLGGNRSGNLRRYENLFVTMCLGGLWHGANWTFLIWGAYHGVLLGVSHLFQTKESASVTSHSLQARLRHIVGIVFTFLCVATGWVIFRAETLTGAGTLLRGMVGLNGGALPAQLASLIPHLPTFVQVVGKMPLLGNGFTMGVVEEVGLILISAILCLCCPPTHEMTFRRKLVAIFFTVGFVVQAIFFERTPSPFLYFRF